jgi:hypothetical protein
MLRYHCVDCRHDGHRGNTERVVAQWRCPVASSKALVMLYWEMCSVLHRSTATAIQMARNGGAFVCAGMVQAWVAHFVTPLKYR